MIGVVPVAEAVQDNVTVVFVTDVDVSPVGTDGATAPCAGVVNETSADTGPWPAELVA